MIIFSFAEISVFEQDPSILMGSFFESKNKKPSIKTILGVFKRFMLPENRLMLCNEIIKNQSDCFVKENYGSRSAKSHVSIFTYRSEKRLAVFYSFCKSLSDF